MTPRLLDVNLLLSMLDSVHVHHERSTNWFLKHHTQGWATCPITENGLIRVASGFGYPNLRLSPAQAADSLHRLQTHYSASHLFWADEVTLRDRSLFDLSQLTGAKQTTDTYLAGLAFSKRAKLATLDGALAWRAVRGATSELVELI